MKPLLSIGIIFKNEIRCLERCVKSLQPLRDAAPCELVMADTGSDDGSREVAARYADILFDFPWINDFAAARNAVIDRCSGEWYLSIDADEWLDTDISQLVRYLTQPERWSLPLCGVMLRNYYTPELDGECNDFLAVRIARISQGLRFTGAIHELWNLPSSVYALEHTLLHHDGYVAFNENQSKEKHERNMKLLREKLAENPESLKTLLQCIESSTRSPSYDSYIRQAVAALEKKVTDYQYYAPPILRYAVLWAAGQKLPELEEWWNWMEREYPDSPYTNIDGAYVTFVNLAEAQNYAAAIPKGELYLKTLADYRAGQIDFTALVFGSFVMATQSREDGVRAILADAYFHENQPEKAREMLLSIDRAAIRPEAVENYIKVMMNLQAQGEEDLSPVLADFWEKTDRPEPRRKQGEACRQAMAAAAETAFSPAHWAAEDEQGFRHAWTLFLPLAGKCEIGNAAKILAVQTPEELASALEPVEDWTALPVSALAHAIENGAEFPRPEKPLNLEVLDNLAARLTAEPDLLAQVLDRASVSANTPQAIAWADRLALAAVQTCKWDGEARNMRLARTFAELESKFLPLCYAAEAPLFVLPPLHRFGYFCARAFEALEAGKKADYVRLLREGLTSCPGMKPMVECLLNQLEEEQQVQALPELLRLADQIRTLLAQYPANDPTVVALKQSEAYQKAAHLIEEPELDIFGGLPS